MFERFKDRTEAGQMLAEKLKKYQNLSDGIIIALPRGGVVTAFEVAKKLQTLLDIVLVRKIAAPGNPEFAIGAVDEHGNGVFNKQILDYYEVSKEYLASEKEKQKQEALRRLKIYRGNRPPLDLTNKTVILVDDGIATGFTTKAAINSIKDKGAKSIILAVPVAPPEARELFKNDVNEIVILSTPADFMAVGQFYEDFPQTTDEEVIDLLYKKPFSKSRV